MATIALFATAAGVAAPARLWAQDIACDRGDQEVRALEFLGNRAISDADLALHVTTTPSSWARRHLNLWFSERRCLNRDELPRDVLRLKIYYSSRGFYSPQIDTLVQPLGPNAVRVVFNISEGPPTRVVSYTIKGLEGIRDSADVVRNLRLHAGQPFDIELYRADIDSIVQRLRQAGYYRASALHEYERDTSRVARATITVLPGKPARFGVPQLFIDTVPGRGQQISDAVVRRLLRISPGQPYSDRAIVEAQRNLFQLGTYQHIEVAPLPDSLQPPGDTIVILAVRLAEDYMRQLDSEFGWATLDCGRVRLLYTDKNLLGSARRLELRGQASKIGYGEPLATPGTRNVCTLGDKVADIREDQFSLTLHYYLGATLRQPRLLGTRWAPTVSLYSERRGEFKAYLRSIVVGADFSATRDVGDRMPLRLAYAAEYGRTNAPDAALCALFSRCDPESRSKLQQLATLGVASATLGRLRTDNLINPTRGYQLRGEVRTSASKLLGTSDSLFFSKGTGDIAWYARAGSRNVLALRIRGGAVVGRRLSLSDTSVGFVPPQERLYAGGPTSVRGFQQNELGDLVYIMRLKPASIDTIATGPNLYRFQAVPDSISIDRAVPLGGNSLLVTNMEYRLRDPFFFPDLLQYTVFMDGGDVWTRGLSHSFKWTPGVGIRALTPVGPIQVNVGYNRYDRDPGALYFNPDVTTLLCVTPGNNVDYTAKQVDGKTVFEQVDNTQKCLNYTPPRRTRRLQRLTFTFSIGSDF